MTDKRMTTQDIVKNSTEVKESKLDWAKAYATLQESLKTDQYRVFRANNTLFWIRIDSPGVAQMYVFNADSYKNLFRNMKDFAMALHKAGYQKVYGETSDMNMINLIKRIGFPVDVDHLGTDEQGRPMYRGTVNV